MKRLFVLAALAGLCLGASKGCQVNLDPNAPPSVPTPGPGTPPSTDPHLPLCDGPAGKVSECWQHPPGQQWLYNCKGGSPIVTGPAECPAAPPALSCSIPDGPEGVDIERVIPAPAGNPAIAEALRAAIRARRTCPDGESPRCLVGVSLQAWREEMVRQLGAQGVCAGLQGGSDEICVLEAPGRCQGWRVGTCGADVAGPGSGCVQGVVVAWPAAGAVRDTWVTKTAVSPANPGGDAVCTEDTPDATTFVLDVRWNTAHTVAWVDATPKLNNREWCGVHYCVDCPWPNRNALVVCPTRPEGHPARVDCDRKHGTPRWFMAVSGGFAPVGSDEGDPFHLHAPLGATVKACLSTDGATACSAELTLQ